MLHAVQAVALELTKDSVVPSCSSFNVTLTKLTSSVPLAQVDGAHLRKTLAARRGMSAAYSESEVV